MHTDKFVILSRKILKNRNWKVRALQVVNHLTVLFFFSYINWSWGLVALTVYFLMFCLGINIGAHRYFSHGTFATYRPFEYLFSFFMNIATVGSVLSWVGMHREHHKFSDTVDDPHSPICHGTWWQRFIKGTKVYFGIWSKYYSKPQYVSDMRRSSMHRFTHNYYLLTIMVYVGILYLIEPMSIVFAYCLPAVLVFHSASFIVTFGHLFGSKKYDTHDESKNSLLLHYLTCGEGLHNSHHAKPHVYWHRDAPWYFFDLPGFLISIVFKRKNIASFGEGEIYSRAP